MTDIITFTYREFAQCFYSCSHPGDHTGEYVRAEEVDWFALNLLLRCRVPQGEDWYYTNDPEARRCVAYFAKRGMVEVDKRGLFRWLAAEAKEAK